MALLVCRTCPRYDARASGRFGDALLEAVTADGREVRVRKVPCLGGCPEDGVVALDGPGMTRVRFARLSPSDAPAIVDAAVRHARSGTGHPEDRRMPAELSGRVSAVTAKREPMPARRGLGSGSCR